MSTETTYDALLSEDEDVATLDCGCEMRRGVYADDSVAFTYCGMHREPLEPGPFGTLPIVIYQNQATGKVRTVICADLNVYGYELRRLTESPDCEVIHHGIGDISHQRRELTDDELSASVARIEDAYGRKRLRLPQDER